MKHIWTRVLVALLAAASVSHALSAQQGPSQARGQASIRLKGGEFRPGLGEQPQIPPGLTISGYAAGQRGYFIVQFEGPVLDSWKAEVSAAGAELLDYIPEFAFKVRMNPAQAARIEGLTFVAWVGVFQPAYKLDPNLVRNGSGVYRVRIERGANAAGAAAAVAATGAQVLQREGSILSVVANPAQLDALAQVLDVASVENLLLRKKHNEYGGGGLMGTGRSEINTQPSVTFTVGSVTHSTLAYEATANHDPDADSNGTAITVLRP